MPRCNHYRTAALPEAETITSHRHVTSHKPPAYVTPPLFYPPPPRLDVSRRSTAPGHLAPCQRHRPAAGGPKTNCVILCRRKWWQICTRPLFTWLLGRGCVCVCGWGLVCVCGEMTKAMCGLDIVWGLKVACAAPAKLKWLHVDVILHLGGTLAWF